MNKKGIGSLLEGLIIPAIIIILWQTATSLGWVKPQLLPSPLAVIVKWWQYLAPPEPLSPDQSFMAWLVSGEMIRDAIGSLSRVLMGFVVGAGLVLNRVNPIFPLLRKWLA